jgi:hypothetical protein
MPPTPKPFLANYLRAVSDDALFLLASTHKMDRELLVEMATRRGTHYATLVQGGTPDCMDWPTWLVNMCVALAPVAPPVWLPMHELIDSLTLETGARGVRSLFTSKPSDKQVERTRAIGSFAVRSLTSVLGAGEAMKDDDSLLRRCVVAALGLPDGDAAVLCQESPEAPEAIEVPADFDPKLAKHVARGIWRAAFRDGLDPREDERSVALCQKMGLTPEDTEAARRHGQGEVDARKILGVAAVDAVRYVLADDEAMGGRLAQVVAHLALPPVHRTEQLSAIEHGGAIVLARRHALEKKQRELCLALVWFAALGTNPDQTRQAELSVRHDRVASDIGSKGEGSAARAAASSFVQDQLATAVQAGGL